ncbi:MAG: M6 family metalloprotease domain-containing protein [Prevotella sp.]|nr:M6 family metalloprotease domain-containing protein [Prevotella sp.]
MKKTLILAMLMLCCVAAKAIPAYPSKKTVTLSDGTTVTLMLRGDEHYSFYTDEDGRAYRMDATGNYVRVDLEQVQKIWGERLQKANQARINRSRARRVGTPSGALTGKKRGLVILVEFQDIKFSVEDPVAVFKDFFNKEGYSDFGMKGSVRDFFKAQSYGKLEIDFDIVGPYVMSQKESYYGKPTEDSNDTNPYEMVSEVVKRAEAEVNYPDYDWDGDGEVDQVFVIFAGHGQNYTGADPNLIWPHESALRYHGGSLKLDGVTVDTYACSSELYGTQGETLMGIGTACHEFSHCLGLPDFYDTNGQVNYGMGSWDVMDSGSYNGEGRGCIPAGYTSYERMFAGWITPIELKDMTRIEGMKPIAESPEAYILYNENNKNEYYLLENRQKVGFDQALYGHGLLVLHVDYDEEVWASNRVNAAASRQRLTIIPADGKTSLSNESGDPFPGRGGVTELTNYTSPAATLYNENVDGKKLMSKPIDNIKESADGLISFVACRPELAIPEPDGGTEVPGEAAFTVTWPAVAGATSYELEVTEIGSASENPAEALERSFDFKEFESKTAGFTDVSTKMGDYGLPRWTGSKLFTSPNRLRIGTSSATGYVRTATWDVPQSSEMTIAIRGKLYKEGTPVKGKIRVAFGNEGDAATYEEQTFELTEDGLMVFSFAIRKNLFWIEIRPDACMYMDYLAIYDGIWTAEQLSASAAKQNGQGPRRASTVTTYTTNTNSYTLKDLNTKSRFIYRVRALGDENTYSQWSEEQTFKFGATGISAVSADEKNDARIYDLNGRYMGTSAATLRKGVYISNGRKVVK